MTLDLTAVKGPAMHRAASPDGKLAQDEFNAYASWLGLNLKTDQHLFWIAKQALTANLPKPWIQATSTTTGEIFFYNTETKESSWVHPFDAYYKALVAEMKIGKGKEQQNETIDRVYARLAAEEIRKTASEEGRTRYKAKLDQSERERVKMLARVAAEQADEFMKNLTAKNLKLDDLLKPKKPNPNAGSRKSTSQSPIRTRSKMTDYQRKNAVRQPGSPPWRDNLSPRDEELPQHRMVTRRASTSPEKMRLTRVSPRKVGEVSPPSRKSGSPPWRKSVGSVSPHRQEMAASWTDPNVHDWAQPTTAASSKFSTREPEEEITLKEESSKSIEVSCIKLDDIFDDEEDDGEDLSPIIRGRSGDGLAALIPSHHKKRSGPIPQWEGRDPSRSRSPESPTKPTGNNSFNIADDSPLKSFRNELEKDYASSMQLKDMVDDLNSKSQILKKQIESARQAASLNHNVVSPTTKTRAIASTQQTDALLHSLSLKDPKLAETLKTKRSPSPSASTPKTGFETVVSQLDESITQREHLQDELFSVNAELVETKKQLEDAEREVVSLRSQTISDRQKLEKLIGLFDVQEEKLEELKTQAHTGTDIVTLQGTVHTLQKKLTELQRDYASKKEVANKHLQKMRVDAEDARIRVDTLASEEARLQNVIAAYRKSAKEEGFNSPPPPPPPPKRVTPAKDRRGILGSPPRKASMIQKVPKAPEVISIPFPRAQSAAKKVPEQLSMDPSLVEVPVDHDSLDLPVRQKTSTNELEKAIQKKQGFFWRCFGKKS